MSVQVENMEKNLAKLTVQIPAEDFEKAVQQVFLKNKNRFNIPGFRKGKASRQVIEKMYGKGIFWEDAVNNLLPGAYSKAREESGLEIVSRPEIDVTAVDAENGVTFTATVAVKPEVTLGQYKGVQVEKADTEVTDEEVMAEIGKEQEKNATTVTVTDRPAELGDTVIIDFEGFVDGEAFEGGKSEDYSLELGSHSFIDTFEDQLVGKNTGDEVEVNVTFPEDYHVDSLKGKPALFKVKVNEIKAKELPEIDDEFASEVSEFDTLDAYKASVKADLKKKKEDEAKREKENAAVDKAVANAQMEIPDAMLDTQAAQMVDNFARRLSAQGMSMEQYMQYTGQNAAALQEQMKPQALKQIQTRLVLEKVAQVENIQISDERLEEEFEKMAKMYGMEKDKLKEILGDAEKDQMREDLAVQEAVTFLADNAVETEEKEEDQAAE